MSPVFVEPTVDWFLLAPYILVLGGGVLGVLLEALLPARLRRPVQLTLSLVVLLAAAAMMGAQWSRLSSEEPVLLVLGGSVILTYFSLILQVIILVIAALALLVVADRTPGGGAFAPTAAAIPGSDYEELARRKGLEQTEIYPLFLFAVGGMMVLPAAGSSSWARPSCTAGRASCASPTSSARASTRCRRRSPELTTARGSRACSSPVS